MASLVRVPPLGDIGRLPASDPRCDEGFGGHSRGSRPVGSGPGRRRRRGRESEIAALQVGLRDRGLYRGTVDGVLGPGTEHAVRRFQRRAGLAADGVPGARTRKALGRYGKRAPLGGRSLVLGMRGWDVAALQFALAWHGFPSGSFDGDFGSHTYEALRKYQRRQGITPDGIAGLRRSPPFAVRFRVLL